ncbi:MAG TPA: hypothetical protein VGG29_06545 [Caulobacteraceae bacterium]|jgi:hypothetical protein
MPDDTERLARIAAPHATVADKIRALAGEGVPRAEIARFLGKRYQHVRNVLEGDAQSGGGGYVLGKADLSGVREGPRAFERDENEAEWVDRRSQGVYWLKPRSDGSLLLPREVAEALQLTMGRRVFATFKEGRLEIVSGDTALADAQALVRKHISPGRSVVDEFIAGRRAMWGEDDADAEGGD